MNNLEELVITFRRAMEIYAHNIKVSNLFLHGFPKGCCQLASEFLQEYLYMNNIETYLVTGINDSVSPSEYHVWLETKNGIIIDITGDQYKFRHDMFFYSEPVYIGPYDALHRLFRIITKEPPMGPDCNTRNDDIKSKNKKDYEGIMQVIIDEL